MNKIKKKLYIEYIKFGIFFEKKMCILNKQNCVYSLKYYVHRMYIIEKLCTFEHLELCTFFKILCTLIFKIVYILLKIL